jgi:hypothetical protein
VCLCPAACLFLPPAQQQHQQQASQQQAYQQQGKQQQEQRRQGSLLRQARPWATQQVPTASRAPGRQQLVAVAAGWGRKTFRWCRT